MNFCTNNLSKRDKAILRHYTVVNDTFDVLMRLLGDKLEKGNLNTK